MTKKSLLLIAMVGAVSSWAMAEVKPPTVPGIIYGNYKSREVAEEKVAQQNAESFVSALEKANYTVGAMKVVKEPTLSEAVFQYAFIVAYTAKEGHQFQPIQRYSRSGYPTAVDAKKAYDTWSAEEKKNGVVLLNLAIQEMAPPPSMFEMIVDYSYPLKKAPKGQ